MTIQEIDIDKIVEPRRDSRFYRDEAWQRRFTRDVEKEGVIVAPLVRPIGDERYEIVDGLTRFYAEKHRGAKTLTCNVQNLNDSDALIYRIKLNENRKEPDYIAVAADLMELKEKHGLKMKDLSQRFNHNPKWLYKLLKLNELSAENKMRVSTGEVTVTDAIAYVTQQAIKPEMGIRTRAKKCSCCNREVSLEATFNKRILCERCDALLFDAHKAALKREKEAARHKRLVSLQDTTLDARQ